MKIRETGRKNRENFPMEISLRISQERNLYMVSYLHFTTHDHENLMQRILDILNHLFSGFLQTLNTILIIDVRTFIIKYQVCFEDRIQIKEYNVSELNELECIPV